MSSCPNKRTICDHTLMALSNVESQMRHLPIRPRTPQKSRIPNATATSSSSNIGNDCSYKFCRPLSRPVPSQATARSHSNKAANPAATATTTPPPQPVHAPVAPLPRPFCPLKRPPPATESFATGVTPSKWNPVPLTKDHLGAPPAPEPTWIASTAPAPPPSSTSPSVTRAPASRIITFPSGAVSTSDSVADALEKTRSYVKGVVAFHTSGG